ncbi:toll/interleukin-1 receptor domain-containing protein [Microbispora rosea]
MHEVFLNYRSDDVGGIAALMESELSRQFGPNHVFIAPQSIEPGLRYSEALLSAVRQSHVLLALIGQRWLSLRGEDGRSLLHDERDWVRREILEALAHKVRVIPVLVGRRTNSLNAAELPQELAVLAKLQNRRLYPDDPKPGLQRIGDDLARLIPKLAKDQRTSEPRPHAGPSVGTIVFRPNGPVHTGSGNLYAGPQLPAEENSDDDSAAGSAW